MGTIRRIPAATGTATSTEAGAGPADCDLG